MKKYVAIVDDDSSFGAYLRTFLSLRGYEARCYTRGDEFLASIEAEGASRRRPARRDDAGARWDGDAEGDQGVEA